MLKITFTGDIMSSQVQNMAIYTKYGNYFYDDIVKPVKELLLESDYLCGNLETPLGDKDFTNSFTCFNTPSQLAYSLKDCGFNLLTTANNHVMDRGKAGLIETIKILDGAGIDHIGTYLSEYDSNQIFIKEINGCKIAFCSFTYGTNSEFHGNMLSEDDICMVDLLKCQAVKPSGAGEISFSFKTMVKGLLPEKIYKRYIKVRTGSDKYSGQLDNVSETEIGNSKNTPYLNRCLQKVRKAKNQADIVVVCCHAGGQYNNEIGEYTKYIFDKIAEAGADVIVGNHPHCVLHSECDTEHKCMKFFSLGNFSFTPDYGFYVDTVYSDFSILLNMYIDEGDKSIDHFGFSILHILRDADNIAQTRSYYDEYVSETDERIRSLMRLNNSIVIKRFLKRETNSIQPEYVI